MNTSTLETYQDLKLVLLTPWGSAVLAVAVAMAVFAIGLSAWSYRRHPRGPRLLLTALRALAIAAVLLLVLQPAIQLRSVARRPNHVAILVDLSRSMTLSENPTLPTRLQRATAVLARSADRIRGWKNGRVVSSYAFGSALRPLALLDERGHPATLVAQDEATRTRAALAALRERHRADDLAGVVLLSDGSDNGEFGQAPLSASAIRFLERFDAPVHTVWTGAPELRDLAVIEVHADDFAFVRNAVKIEAELLISGLPVREVPVTLRQGERTLAQRRVVLEDGKTRHRVEFEFVPQRVGKYVFSVSAPVFEGEALTSNNSRSFVVKVIRDRIRVLQICGRPSWDQRFLRQLLKRDPNVDLISFFILRTMSSLSNVPPGELSLIPFPTAELFERELGSFDLVILQNFDFGPYGIGVYLPHLRRYVETGGALAMIGGDLSFSSGGYADTEIAEVLPVKLLRPTVDPARLVSLDDFRVEVTARGRTHPIMQIGRTRDETARLLPHLPQLSGVNRVAGLHRDATALAVHPTLRTESGRPMPVLAVREVDRGRTLALTSDSSWHWAFAALDGPAGSRQGYDRFWRNAIRWLIRDPESKYLRVIAQRSTVRLGQEIEVLVRAYSPDYSPASGLELRYEVSASSGDVAGVAREAKTDERGELRLRYRPTVTGPHRVRVTARIGGRRTSEEELVLVEEAGPELRDPRANARLLQQISAATGGRYLGQASSLPELRLRPPRVVRVNWRSDVELWSRWWWLAGAVLLLTLEWLVRRRYGHH